MRSARGTYEMAGRRTRWDKDYLVTCYRCGDIGVLRHVVYARNVPRYLRQAGWRTRAGKWVCPECLAQEEAQHGK